MSKLVKAVQDFEGRNIHVLFAHRCRAKTYKGIANLLNTKYVLNRVDLGDDRFFSEHDVAEMFRTGFLEQRDGYIYVLTWL